MAESNPSILRADLPREAQPNNTFPVEVEIEQGGGDPWASEGNCVTSGLDITGWVTPVELVVDGEVVDKKGLCMASGNTQKATLSGSVSSGTHRIGVRVYKVGGNAYDLQPPIEEVNDEQYRQITASADASDPSEKSTSDRLIMFLEDVSNALGTSVNMVALGALLAVGVFLFI